MRVVRLSKLTPSRCSSARRWLPTMVVEIPHSCAAAVMLPVSTTFTYTDIAWNRSIIKPWFKVIAVILRLSSEGG